VHATWAKSTRVATFFLSVACAFASAGAAATAPKRAIDPAETAWVESRLAALTLRQKIGQMLMVDLAGTAVTPETTAHFDDGAFGNVIFFERNVKDEDQTRVFIAQLQRQAQIATGVPLFVAVDQEGGQVNRLGNALDLRNAKHSARLLGRVYAHDQKRATRVLTDVERQIGKRMRDVGFNMNLAPVLDVTDERRSFIYDRSFGGDPKLVAGLGATLTAAMQTAGVACTGKHFPSLGSTVTDSHRDLPVLDRTLPQLMQNEWLPFRALRDRLAAVMIGHVIVPAIDPVGPASLSPRVVSALRNTIGFSGVVISDDIKMRAVSAHYGFEQIVLASVDAGIDVILVAWGPERQKNAAAILERAVATGRVTAERINTSVRRVLRAKYRFVASVDDAAAPVGGDGY
jgi:beta-N-acetylhexosaminidase